jgi:hypothetical protein
MELQAGLRPLLQQVESLTEKIKACEAELKQIAEEKYPETELLQQIKGVGPLIALSFVLTVEDPERFKKSRDVGCYVGLRPKRSESGEQQPQLGITKEGDIYLRKMLVQGAHYILGHHGPDTDLRRWGSKLAQRGGKNAKKRAIVAVARKLGILLHRLWVTGVIATPGRLRHNAQLRKAKGHVATRRVRVTARSRQNQRYWRQERESSILRWQRPFEEQERQRAPGVVTNTP